METLTTGNAQVKIWNRLCTFFLFLMALFTMIRTLQARQRDTHQFHIALGMFFFSTLETLGMLLCSIYAAEVKSFFNGFLDYSVIYQRKLIINQ